MSQSADNIASDIESSLTSNNKLEIINLRGQYSDVCKNTNQQNIFEFLLF